MTFRPAAGTARAVPAATLLALVACSSEPVDRPPDLLLISVDTLRADRVSAYGYERATTPELDALAAEGVLFANAVAPSSQTAPSHMSVFTGLDPLAHGVRNVRATDDGALSVSEDLPLLPEVFLDAGYRTAVIGDTGNVHPDMGFGRGFEFTDFQMLPVATKAKVLEQVCEDVAADESLFVFFHTYQVHAPYLPPEPFRGRFGDPGYRGEFRRRYEELVGRPPALAFRLASGFLEPFDGMGDEDLRWLSDLYDEGVAWTDADLGAIARLWREQRGEDALVVVFSDHGEEFGEHGRIGHKTGLSRVLTHVPLVFSGAGVGRGRVGGTVSLTDLAATLVELCGLDVARLDARGSDGSRRRPQGVSFAQAVRAPEAAGELSMHAHQQLEVSGDAGRWEALSSTEEHFVRRTTPDGEQTTLYRLADDPLARVPSEPRDGEQLARLRERLDERRQDALARRDAAPPRTGAELTEQRRQELRALGYVGDDED